MHADGPDPTLPIVVSTPASAAHRPSGANLAPEEDHVYLGDDFSVRGEVGRKLGECAPQHRLPAGSRREADRHRLYLAAGAEGSSPRAGRRRARGRGGGGDRAGGRDAAAITDSGRVGVLATPATVAGGAYLRALGRQHRELTVQVAAPDLAAIIQRGFPFSEAVVETVRSYCAPLKRARSTP